MSQRHRGRATCRIDWERNFVNRTASGQCRARCSATWAVRQGPAGFAGRIVSPERCPPFAVLQRSASTDPLGMPALCARMPMETTDQRVAGKQAMFRLPMLKRHQDAFHQPTTWAPNGCRYIDSIPWLQTFGNNDMF